MNAAKVISDATNRGWTIELSAGFRGGLIVRTEKKTRQGRKFYSERQIVPGFDENLLINELMYATDDSRIQRDDLSDAIAERLRRDPGAPSTIAFS